MVLHNPLNTPYNFNCVDFAKKSAVYKMGVHSDGCSCFFIINECFSEFDLLDIVIRVSSVLKDLVMNSLQI